MSDLFCIFAAGENPAGVKNSYKYHHWIFLRRDISSAMVFSVVRMQSQLIPNGLSRRRAHKIRPSDLPAWLDVHMTLVHLMEALLSAQLRRTRKGTVSGLMLVCPEL